MSSKRKRRLSLRPNFTKENLLSTPAGSRPAFLLNDDVAEKQRLREKRRQSLQSVQRPQSLMRRPLGPRDPQRASSPTSSAALQPDSKSPRSPVRRSQTNSPKRNKRLSPVKQRMRSPNSGRQAARPTPKEMPPQAERLSGVQLTELYSECVNLAARNKITQENSWSLHLIDHVQDVVSLSDTGDKINFQKASCTLDASVMIYSSRVDSVHKDTFKVLGSFSRGKTGNMEDADGVDDGSGAAKKRNKKARTSTLETNLNNINNNDVELEYRQDPLFHRTTQQFDQGGASGLLLNVLTVYDGCNIAFDSAVIPDAPEQIEEEEEADNREEGAQVEGGVEVEREALKKEKRRARALKKRQELVQKRRLREQQATQQMDLSRLTNMLALILKEQKVVGLGDLPLCPKLGELQRMGDDDDGDASDDSDCNDGTDVCGDHVGAELDAAIAKEEQAFQTLEQEALQSQAQMDELDGLDFDDNDGPPNDMQSAIALSACAPDFSDLGLDDNINGNHMEMGLAPIDEDYDSDNSFGESDQEGDGPQSLLLMGMDDVSSKTIRAWAGPSHWKFRAKSTKAGGEGKGKPARKVKKVFYIDFSDEVEEVPESAFALPKGRTTTTLAKSTLAKAATERSKYLLPKDIHFSIKDLVRLFLRPDVLSTVRRKRKTKGEPGHSGAFALHDFGADVDADESDNADDPVGDFQLGASLQDDLDAPLEVDESFLDHTNEDLDDMDGLDGQGEGTLQLVEAAKRVGKIDIRYAKFAKQVDVRKLKKTIWHQIKTAPEPSPEEPRLPGEEDPEDLKADQTVSDEQRELLTTLGARDAVKASNSFQAAISNLHAVLPSSTLKNISVPYCFICLLHLANERDLALVPGTDYVDPNKHTTDSDTTLVAARKGLGDFSIFHAAKKIVV